MVICRFLRVVPLFGDTLLYMVWGGYSIRWVTYELMLVLHFILPFVVVGLILLHLSSLHSTGRTCLNTGLNCNNKVSFYPYF